MSGLFRRLSSRRSDGPEGNEPREAAQPGAADAPATTPAEPGGRRSLLTGPAAPTGVPAGRDPAAPAAPTAHAIPADVAAAPAGSGATTPVAPAGYAMADLGAPMPVADVPAGLDADELAAMPATSARRGRLRRRAAFLRAARELLLRDLGGFVYELHRTAHDVEHEAHRRLRETKLARLSRVDAELHELEQRLDDVRRQVLVREPGVGGQCPRCGELFGSDARYCAHCGLPLTESADQPTQEISPPGPHHPGAGADFRWPRREDAEATPGASWAIETRDAAADSGEPAAAAAQTPEIAPAEEILAPSERRP